MHDYFIECVIRISQIIGVLVTLMAATASTSVEHTSDCVICEGCTGFEEHSYTPQSQLPEWEDNVGDLEDDEVVFEKTVKKQPEVFKKPIGTPVKKTTRKQSEKIITITFNSPVRVRVNVNQKHCKTIRKSSTYISRNASAGFIQKIPTIFQGLFKGHIRFSRTTY